MCRQFATLSVGFVIAWSNSGNLLPNIRLATELELYGETLPAIMFNSIINILEKYPNKIGLNINNLNNTT